MRLLESFLLVGEWGAAGPGARPSASRLSAEARQEEASAPRPGSEADEADDEADDDDERGRRGAASPPGGSTASGVS